MSDSTNTEPAKKKAASGEASAPPVGSNGRQPPIPPATENVFKRALQARNDQAARPTVRVVKAPSRVRPTTKVPKGWFRTHEAMFGPYWVFAPKDDGGFSDEPVFVMPELVETLRKESTAFLNAIREVMGYLVYTRGGAHYFVLIPVPDELTGRYHPATEQKLDALEQARFVWKRLDWDKARFEFDDLTATDLEEEPKWQEDTSEEAILHRTFGERNVIRALDDLLLQTFRAKT